MMPESKGVARISKTEEIENPELVSVLSNYFLHLIVDV